MTSHTAFHLRLNDGLGKHQCIDDGRLVPRKEPITSMLDLRPRARGFLPSRPKSDLGAAAEWKLDFAGGWVGPGGSGRSAEAKLKGQAEGVMGERLTNSPVATAAP